MTHRFLYGLVRLGESVAIGEGMALVFDRDRGAMIDLTNSRAKTGYHSRIEISADGSRAAVFMSPLDPLPNWEHMCEFDGHCYHYDECGSYCCYCDEPPR